MDAFTKMAGQPDFFKSNGHNGKKKRRAYRPHMHGGVRSAVLRALTAAELYREERFPTVAAAAQGCGSNSEYVVAALTILDAGDREVHDEIVSGRASLLTAARKLRALALLLRAYRATDAADLPAFGKTVGVANLFDHAIAPAL
jgi:hypothetical protein